jgi:hypothetical protein
VIDSLALLAFALMREPLVLVALKNLVDIYCIVIPL